MKFLAADDVAEYIGDSNYDGAEWDDPDSLTHFMQPYHGDNASPPETVQLVLPSTIGRERCLDRGLDHLLAKEMKLRKGQMHDALDQIMVAIGYKSFLFKHKVRTATNYAKRLRSFAHVRDAQDVIRQHARIYSMARRAALKLCDPGHIEHFAEKYKKLQDGDLEVKGMLVEPEQRGLRNENLPWIWTFGFKKKEDNGDWLEEREHAHTI